MHRAKWTRADEKRPTHKVDVRDRRAPQPVATTPAAEPQPVATPAEPASTNLPRLRGRSHVVRPGESLWSIAAARLGPEASAGAIAREVRRLWKLNRARIGAGDPSVLPIGVHLRLR
jgi:nucleoid-associated protein YgaU